LSGIMVFIQGPVLRKALKKFSEEKLVIIGSIILGTNFILFVSNNVVSVGCAIILFAVGNGLMWPQDVLDQNFKAQYKALQVVLEAWQVSWG
jgi:DHA1 family tetracycline resistance protein-like MFS transporter